MYGNTMVVFVIVQYHGFTVALSLTSCGWSSRSVSSRAEGFEFPRCDLVFLMRVDSPQTSGDSCEWSCSISVIMRDASVCVCVWPWALCQTPPLHHRHSSDPKHRQEPCCDSGIHIPTLNCCSVSCLLNEISTRFLLILSCWSKNIVCFTLSHKITCIS